MSTESHHLFQKSVFLLAPSVGKDMAETLVRQALGRIGSADSTLAKDDIVRLAASLEPALKPFVGDDKAQRLASALRVLVGGVIGATAK